MKIKAIAFAGAALAASYAVPAQADGLPYVTVANWSGYYVGANLGFAHVSDDVTVTDGWAYIGGTGSDTKITGGLLAGYNWQRGDTVWGIEGDVNFMSDIDLLASVRGRYGVVRSNWLYYGTAGLAYIDAGDSYSGFGFHYDGYSSAGFVIGAGAETKINSHLSAGVEGLYYIFPEQSQDVGWGITVKESADIFSVRGRLTYHIDAPYDYLK